MIGRVLGAVIGCVSLSAASCSSIPLGFADRSALHASTLVEACPLGVPWTRIGAQSTPRGTVVTFATDAPRVDELRRRVHAQARASGPDRHVGEGHDGQHRGPREHGLQLWALGAITVSVSDTETGATIEIAPVDATREDEIRWRIMRRVEKIHAAPCPS